MLSDGFKFTPLSILHVRYFIPGLDVHSVFVAESFEGLALGSDIEFVEHGMDNEITTPKEISAFNGRYSQTMFEINRTMFSMFQH